MNKYTDKPQDSKNQATNQLLKEEQNSIRSSFKGSDNRPEVTTLKKMQEAANCSPHAQHLIQMQALIANSPRTIAQMQVVESSRGTPTKQVSTQPTIQNKKNTTGLPDKLKSGIENLSGYSMDDVKVHYNSSQPAQLQAHAFTRGTNIHVASGQERHLPHEAWHVVQQKQGRVKPTLQMQNGLKINDERGLEQEADKMGEKIGNELEIHQISDSSFQSSINLETVQKVSMPDFLYDLPTWDTLTSIGFKNYIKNTLKVKTEFYKWFINLKKDEALQYVEQYNEYNKNKSANTGRSKSTDPNQARINFHKSKKNPRAKKLLGKTTTTGTSLEKHGSSKIEESDQISAGISLIEEKDNSSTSNPKTKHPFYPTPTLHGGEGKTAIHREHLNPKEQGIGGKDDSNTSLYESNIPFYPPNHERRTRRWERGGRTLIEREEKKDDTNESFGNGNNFPFNNDELKEEVHESSQKISPKDMGYKEKKEFSNSGLGINLYNAGLPKSLDREAQELSDNLLKIAEQIFNRSLPNYFNQLYSEYLNTDNLDLKQRKDEILDTLRSKNPLVSKELIENSVEGIFTSLYIEIGSNSSAPKGKNSIDMLVEHGLVPQRTVPDGSCSVHAIFGEMQPEGHPKAGSYYDPEFMEKRSKLSQAFISGEGEKEAVAHAMLKESFKDYIEIRITELMNENGTITNYQNKIKENKTDLEKIKTNINFFEKKEKEPKIEVDDEKSEDVNSKSYIEDQKESLEYLEFKYIENQLSCSLCQFIGNRPSTEKPDIRKEACNSGEVKQLYANLLKSRLYWLGSTELHALATLYDVSLKLYERGLGGLQISGHNVEGNNPIAVYSSGSHYERLEPIEEDEVLSIQSRKEDPKESKMIEKNQPSNEDSAWMKWVHSMYEEAKKIYHQPFKNEKGEKTKTGTRHIARNIHGLSHVLRTVAYSIAIAHQINHNQQIESKEAVFSNKEIQALALATLFHDSANLQEFDKTAGEKKQSDKFLSSATKQSTWSKMGSLNQNVVRFAANSLKDKGAVKKSENYSKEERAASVIAGSDSYDFMRDRGSKSYNPQFNKLMKINIFDRSQDESFKKLAHKLILETDGYQREEAKNEKSHDENYNLLKNEFEFRGVESILDGRSKIHKAFVNFGQQAEGVDFQQFMNIFRQFAGQSTDELGIIEEKSRLQTNVKIEKPKPPTAEKPTFIRSDKDDPKKHSNQTELDADIDSKNSKEPLSEKPTFIRRGKRGPKKFPQGKPSEFKSSKLKEVKVDFDKTACMVHGIRAEHLSSVISNGYLESAYHRIGPNNDSAYGRDSDKRGGGAFGVYIRTVGRKHEKWLSKGMGVGSDSKEKVQLVLSPNVLKKIETRNWRANSSDGGGRAPGVRIDQTKELSWQDMLKELWGCQSEQDRNQQFNSVVNTDDILQNNEQLIWEKVDLKGNLIAIICTSENTFQIVSQLSAYNPDAQTITVNGENIPVVLAGDQTFLLGTLRNRGLMDKNNKLRESPSREKET